MPHAARQLPSWLIFDVGQKMKSIPVVLIVYAMLCAAVAASGGAPPPVGKTRLVFDGYMKSPEGVLFAVSLKKPDESFAARAWMAVGQSFAGYEIVSFDDHNETLWVRDAGDENHELKLPADRVRDGSATSAQASDGFLRAMENVNQFLQRLRTAWNERVEFRLDIEGDAMPAAVRARFLASRDREEAKNGYLVGVCIDQEWHFSLFSGQAASTVIRESLTEAERRKIEVAWALAQAEAGARALALKKRGDPMPTLDLNK